MCMNRLEFKWWVLIFGILSLTRVHALTLYVTLDGCDSFSGVFSRVVADPQDGPLATLDGARRRVRQMRAEKKIPAGEAVDVIIADGTYSLTEPIIFEPEDSGETNAPVNYQAARGACPVFSGGVKLPPFEANSDGVWRIRVPKTMRFEQLYVNRRRATRARSPNRFTYYYMQAPVPYGIDPLTGKNANLSYRAFIADKSDIAPLFGKSQEMLSNVVVRVFHSWEVSQARVQAIDPETGQVVVTRSTVWPYFHWKTYLPRYQLENFAEALDEPGEWYLDDAGLLSYLPLPDETVATSEAIAPVAQAFIHFRGDAMANRWVTDLSFKGLCFKHAGYHLPPEGQGDGQAASRQPAVIELDGVRSIAFRDCEVAHTGTHAIWFRKGCRESVVERCYLHDLGGGAVRIGDVAWQAAELPDKLTGKIVIDNNILQGGGRIFTGATGVWIGHASDVQVTHNDIADFYYTGISMGWTWGYRETATHRNTLAFNHIHHIGWGVLSDMGGIYTLGQCSETVVTNNHIHDVYSYDYTGRGGWGLYTDEGSAQMVFENNLVHHVKTGCIHQHYGRENIFRNNILAFSMEGQIQRSRIEAHTTVIITNNIIYWDNPSAAFWRGHANAKGSITDVVFNANTYWNPNGIPTNAFNCDSWDAWRTAGNDRDSQIVDPLFRDPQQGDFRFQKGSPAVKAGFKPFDVRCAGVYGSHLWQRQASRAHYPDVCFAPEPPRFHLRKQAMGFEEMAIEAPIPYGTIHVEKKGDRIAVTDKQAFTGKQSLEIRDAPGLTYAYNPHLTFDCVFTNGVVENRFAVRMETGAEFFTEWRDHSSRPTGGYAIGPSLLFRKGQVVARTQIRQPDGTQRRGERVIAKVPNETWVQVQVTVGVGTFANKLWTVVIKCAGQPDVTVADLQILDPLFDRVEWLGFCSTATVSSKYYLDDFVFEEKSH